jgi:hypothetical protein
MWFQPCIIKGKVINLEKSALILTTGGLSPNPYFVPSFSSNNTEDCTLWDMDDMKKLAELLLKNNHVRELKLGIGGNEGIFLISKSLRQNFSITRLDLEGCGISDEGFVTISELLQENKIITWLDLNGNKASAKGLLALSKALTINSSLIVLGLGCRKFHPQSYQDYSIKFDYATSKDFCCSIEKNSSLRAIDLIGTKIDPQVLSQSLHRKKTPFCIWVANCDVLTMDNMNCFAEVLAKNPNIEILYDPSQGMELTRVLNMTRFKKFLPEFPSKT